MLGLWPIKIFNLNHKNIDTSTQYSSSMSNFVIVSRWFWGRAVVTPGETKLLVGPNVVAVVGLRLGTGVVAAVVDNFVVVSRWLWGRAVVTPVETKLLVGANVVAVVGLRLGTGVVDNWTTGLSFGTAKYLLKKSKPSLVWSHGWNSIKIKI